MIDRNQNVILELDGQIIGFRFSTWALKQTQLKAGCKGIVQLLTKIGFDDSNIDLDSLSLLAMEAYNDYIHFTQQPIKENINQRQSCELIDKLGGVIEFLAKVSEGLESHIPKNTAPPQMAGEVISQ